MELIRLNPARDMFGRRHGLDAVFSNFFNPATDAGKGTPWDWHPAVDIYDNTDGIVIKAELPGVDKKDIVVDIKDRVLTLKGERSVDKDTEKDRFYRRERFFGKFERAFTLPENVNTDGIKADFKDGLLEILVPKPETVKPKQITIH